MTLSASSPGSRLPMPLLLLLALLLGFAFPQKAQALTCSATVTDVDFGTPNLLSTSATDVLATLTVTCTGVPILTAIKMCPSLDDGSGGSNGSARLMTGPGGATLQYQLYQDSSRTLAWGSLNNPDLGTVPPITLSSTLSGAVTATRTIYGRLFGSQLTAPPGSYDSAYTGAEAAFTYSLFFLSASGSCTGFVGTSVIHPEFDVVAAPLSGCTLATADLAFPSSGVLSSAITGQTSIKVTCTNKTAYSIALDNGRSGTAPAARNMTSAAGDAVTYGLYRDSARTAVWGSSTGQLVAGVGTGSEQSFTVYGVVPAQSTPKPAAYSDRIIVTLTY